MDTYISDPLCNIGIIIAFALLSRSTVWAVLCRSSVMESDEQPLSTKTLKVLAMLLSAPNEAFSGADIGRETKLQAGTLYPILARLEEVGWLESRWEVGDPKMLGRPRKHFRSMTDLGIQNASHVFKKFKIL